MTDPGDDSGDREFLEAAGIDPSGTTPERDQLASLAQRAIARSIDLLVVAVISLALLAPQIRTSGPDDTVPRWAQVGVLIVWVAYEAATTAWLGQTMGKLAMGCRVVDRKTGQRPGVARAVVRAAVVPGLLPILAVLAFGVYGTAVLDRPERRGLLDRLAGTAVIKATPRDR